MTLTKFLGCVNSGQILFGSHQKVFADPCTRQAAKFLENLSDSDNEHGEKIDDVQSEDSKDDGANFSDEIQETEDKEDSATEEEHDEVCAAVAKESNSSTASSNTISMNPQTLTGKNGR